MRSKIVGGVEGGANFTATVAMVEFIIEHSESDFNHDDPQFQRSCQWMKQRIRSLNLVVSQIVFGVQVDSDSEWAIMIIVSEFGSFGEFIRAAINLR